MSDSARVIFDGPSTGCWNMAVDQALLMAAENEDRATLRFYRWSEPTLSLGYFQTYEDRKKHEASVGCSVVRRRSGGGAIMHDNELTYSLSLPSSNRWSKQNAQLYDLVHELIIDQLAKNDLKAILYRDLEKSSASQNSQLVGGVEAIQEKAGLPFVSKDAFLCFQRRTAGDIVMDGFKIVGSAQRRLKHSLLQHGSLLFTRSEYASELPGISELHKPVDVGEFARELATGLRDKLKIEFVEQGLGKNERKLAGEIEETVFSQSTWTKKR